jgi:hypothetical protein
MRTLIVDGPASLGARTRARRWDLLAELFQDLESYRVLDLGGTAGSWLRAPVRPAAVTLLNLYGGELTVGQEGEALPNWLDIVEGDACDPPSAIRETDFDLVFSNSLIEHVGGPTRRQMLARFVREAAPRYWIQTPYRYFPVEPHWIFPGFQFLPLTARATLSRTWPLMHTRARGWEDSVSTALQVELIGLTELKYLFPDATLHKEWFGGLIKSVIAVRR